MEFTGTKVTSSLAPTSFLLFTWFCSLAPPRQTQSPRGFSCDPLPGVCLGPWALARGYGLDSVPWQSQGVTRLALPGLPCPCVLPEVALSVPTPAQAAPPPGAPYSAGCHTPHSLGRAGSFSSPRNPQGLLAGQEPPSTEATAALLPWPGPTGGSIAHSLLTWCGSLTRFRFLFRNSKAEP